MPNWKKVIVSGSNAALNSLNVTTNVVAQSFTGSLQGTSSWAVSALTASYADNFTVAGTLTAQTIVVQTITSSTDYVTGSTIFGSQLTNTHQFTGSVSITGSLTANGINNLTASNAVTASHAVSALTASYAVTASFAQNAQTASNIQGGATNYIPVFNSPTSLSSSVVYQSGSHIGINITNFTSGDPEALYVFQTHPTSFNVITGKGNSNNYLQLNIQNTNTGTTASSDIVATADNGTETSNYIDMGINGSNFSGPIGDPNDAYLYSAGNHLHIGNITPGQPLQFFVGGDDTNLYRKLQLNDNNQHNITGSLNVSGSVTAFSFTGSLQGTSSWAENAITASHAVNALSASYALNATNAISASYATSASHANNATSASYALNATNASTASYVLNAVSASFATTALTASYADNFTVAGTLTAQTIVVQTITSSTDYVTGSTIFGSSLNNTHQFTGSVSITGSLSVNNSNVILTNQTSSMTVLSSSYAISASYAINADFLDGQDGSAFATTGSNIFIGNQTVTGSLFTTGSNTLIGSTTLTGSLNITGSTIQTGDNTLIGNTILSGSIIISGSTGPGAATASVQIYGDIRQSGYHRFDPVTTNIDTSISASYIFVSGSTNDLYFSQNGAGYSNVTRLRWLEGNLYTGLLNGGLITTQSSTVYQISSGSGIIVNLNASLNNNPYPTIQYLNWNNLSASIAPLTSSYQQAFVGIDSTNNIFAQGTPFSNGQFDTIINIGNVLFQNQSTINGVKTQPSTAYGFEQQQNVFNRAFGPLKLSGYTLAPSGSSTGSLVVGSGTAYSPGSNYTVDPNEPYYTVDSGTSISKIFRYYQSGSSWVYLTNAGAGFGTIDPSKYSNNGTLDTVANNSWSIQRAFWFPNSVTKAIVVYYGNTVFASEVEAIANINIESFVEAPNTAANAIYLGAIVIKGDGVFTTATDFTIVPGGLFRQVGGSGGGGSIVTQTLSGLSDVLISGPTDGQALVYSTTSGKWENKSSISASISGNAATATSASYAITASYALTATTASHAISALSASYSVTSSNVQGGTANYISVWKTATSLSSSVFYQDPNNNNYVGLFTTVPTYSLDINGTVRSQNDLRALTKVYFPGLVNTPQTNVVVWDTAQGELFYQSTSSLLVNTASYALNATSASYALNATSASYALNATSASYALNATSASYALNSTTASYAATSSNILGGTQYYVPFFNTNTTVSSSFLYQSGSILKTIFNSDQGLYINFTNTYYALGINVGTGQYAGFTYNANVGISKIGDPDKAWVYNGVGLIIDEDNNFIKSRYDNNDIGLKLDFTNNQYKLGDFTDGNITINNTRVDISKSTYITGSLTVSGITNVSKANVVTYDTTTGQLYYQTTSSLSVTSASYAATASTANSGFTVGITQTYTNTVASTVVGSNNVFTQTTGSYTSAFYKYTVSNGANARSGEVIAVWNGSSAQYTDYSTLDIGSTSGVTPSVSVVGSDILFNISTGTSGWRLKATVTYL